MDGSRQLSIIAGTVAAAAAAAVLVAVCFFIARRHRPRRNQRPLDAKTGNPADGASPKISSSSCDHYQHSGTWHAHPQDGVARHLSAVSAFSAQSVSTAAATTSAPGTPPVAVVPGQLHRLEESHFVVARMPTVKSLWAAVSTGSASLRRENKGKLHCELGVTNVIAATAPFPPPEYGSRFSWTSGDDSSAESESETEDAWQPLPSASSTFQTLSISLRGHPYSIGYLEGLDREADREDIERGGLGHSFWKSIRRNAWRTSTGQDEESGVGGSVTAAGGFAASVWAAIQTRVSVVPVEDSEMDVGAAVDLST